MLLYRVFPYLASALPREPGHPAYIHRPQGMGRLDNPHDYDCVYFSAEPSAAVGEVFGQLAIWSEGMFDFPGVPGALRALATFQLPDDTPVLDLDDARALLDRGLRPSQVVGRIRPVSQEWALRIFREADLSRGGARRWDGVRWWSFYGPHWRVFGMWANVADCVAVDDLHIDHPVVRDAARALSKKIAPPASP